MLRILRYTGLVSAGIGWVAGGGRRWASVQVAGSSVAVVLTDRTAVVSTRSNHKDNLILLPEETFLTFLTL